ncbi:MAG: ABC transporter permease [Limnochordia bacterium]|jgi:ribose transport system permease protein|nr:ABC transporter permease [Limnochordia bacterium]MDI9438358.1 ABC transporter permease [Bacillota bacterium]
MFQRFGKRRTQQILVLAGLLLVFVIIHLATGSRFLTRRNLGIIVSHAVIPTFITWGLIFSFTSGMIDLSIGAIVVLASNLAGILGLKFGYAGLIVGGLAAGVALQALNGFVFLKTKIPPWVAGLGMAMIYESIGAFYSNMAVRSGGMVVSLGSQLRSLGQLPYNVLMLVPGLIAVYILFCRTSIGLNVRAVGSDIRVTKEMGIDPNRAKFLGMLVCGLFIGLGSAINQSYVGQLLPRTGLTTVSTIFQPLTAVLIASSMAAIFNVVVGVVIGTISLSALFNALTLLGVPSGTWQEVVLGMLVIAVTIVSMRGEEGVVK